jgi:hypothetical protein
MFHPTAACRFNHLVSFKDRIQIDSRPISPNPVLSSRYNLVIIDSQPPHWG